MLEKEFYFESFDLDQNGAVKISAVMRKMQQAAREDLASCGLSYYEMRSYNCAFVLSKLAVEQYADIREGDKILLSTFAVNTHGATFIRDFTASRSGKAIFRATTRWALIDCEKRRILRPSYLKNQAPENPELATDIPYTPIRFPENADGLTAERVIYRSMLDENSHLNNCVFADIITDHIPEADIGVLRIDFDREITLGKTLVVNTCRADGKHLVRGVCKEEGYTVFEASVTERKDFLQEENDVQAD